MEAIQKIKARIMALLAKANGTDNEHEAEAFLAKAMELMQQYQLDVSDMVDADDPILHHTGMSEQGQAKRVAAALITRIHKLIRDQEQREPTTAAGRNALVVLNQVVAKYDELYPTAETMKARATVTDGLARKAAEGIGLHRQTSGRSALQIGCK